MARAPTDLLYGTLDMLVLETLAWRPMHGYAISTWIRQRSGGTLEEMEAALAELAMRNLARTDELSRSRTMLHPVPSITARLGRARRYLLWYGEP